MTSPVHPAPVSFALALCAAAYGCGPTLEEYPVAAVSGVVLCDGEPVREGRIQFTPVREGDSLESGKPGWGTLAQDGRFTLTTYGRDDGAVVGEHRVTIWSQRGEQGSRDAADPELAPGCPGGRLSETYTVSEDGPNEFTIELSESE